MSVVTVLVLVARVMLECRRAAVQARHGLPDSVCLADWHQLLGRGKLADIVIIATQDAQHKEPAVAFAALGYHILVI